MLRFFLPVCAALLGACSTAPAPQPPAFSSARGPALYSDSAISCGAAPDAATRQIVPERGLDRALLNRAILDHTNRARCHNGLPPLRADTALQRIATGHSTDMVRLGFYGHTSPVPGKASVRDRLISGIPNLRGGAENLATINRLAVENGEQLYPLEGRSCAYSRTPSGPAVPMRTYDAMAQNLVERWMASPGHRQNLMNPAYTRHGASGAIDPNARLCERVNVTQLFAG